MQVCKASGKVVNPQKIMNSTGVTVAIYVFKGRAGICVMKATWMQDNLIIAFYLNQTKPRKKKQGHRNMLLSLLRTIWRQLRVVCMYKKTKTKQACFAPLSWQQLPPIPHNALMWSHARRGIPRRKYCAHTADAVDARAMGDICYASANISVLAERYRCPEGSVTSHSASLLFTKRWRG